MVSSHAVLLLICPKGLGDCAALFFLFVAFGMGLKAIRFVPLLSGLSHASHSVANKP